MIRALHPLPRQVRNEPVLPYSARPAGKPIRVLLDRPTMANDEASEVLDALIDQQSEIEAWWTTPRADRWIDIDWQSEANDHIPVTLHSPESKALMTIYPASTWKKLAAMGPHGDLSEAEALRQLGYANVAAQDRFHLFVSDSTMLSHHPSGVAAGVNVRRSAEAVAHLALFLRSREIYSLGDRWAYAQNRF